MEYLGKEVRDPSADAAQESKRADGRKARADALEVLLEKERTDHEQTKKHLSRTLMFFRKALLPGQGVEHAKHVRKVCDAMGWDEDVFLDRMFVRDKKRWGLTPRKKDGKVQS
jgi:hypothetical protein